MAGGILSPAMNTLSKVPPRFLEPVGSTRTRLQVTERGCRRQPVLFFTCVVYFSVTTET